MQAFRQANRYTDIEKKKHPQKQIDRQTDTENWKTGGRRKYKKEKVTKGGMRENVTLIVLFHLGSSLSNHSVDVEAKI